MYFAALLPERLRKNPVSFLLIHPGRKCIVNFDLDFGNISFTFWLHLVMIYIFSGSVPVFSQIIWFRLYPNPEDRNGAT